MADFCWDCLAESLYPEAPERNDFYGLCKPGYCIAVLCEGHGWIEVDHEGKRLPEPRPLPIDES